MDVFSQLCHPGVLWAKKDGEPRQVERIVVYQYENSDVLVVQVFATGFSLTFPLRKEKP